MRVLLAHNYYQQRGGEDQVFESEYDLLKSNGIDVERFSVHNDSITQSGKLAAFANGVWNASIKAQLSQIVAEFGPDIVHFHNTWPLVSPAAYAAAREGGAKVVQTLHNYRMVCPAATLFRDGENCSKCAGKMFAWPGIVHQCYRQDAASSAAIATSYAIHRALGTWKKNVDLYLVLSDFQKNILTSAGLKASRIAVKPNFLAEDPGEGDGSGAYVLFAGRIVEEKGVRTAVDVWLNNDMPLPLFIAGDGPLKDELQSETKDKESIRWLGFQPKERLRELTQQAVLALAPSEWPEPFGLVAIEALACGTPVAAARSGALPEIIEDGKNGILFAPREPRELHQKVHSLLENQELLGAMRRAARLTYESKYTAKHNAEVLLQQYSSILRHL